MERGVDWLSRRLVWRERHSAYSWAKVERKLVASDGHVYHNQGLDYRFMDQLLPPSLIANMGSALLWAQILHLLVGNFMLGVIEGALISRWIRGTYWIAAVWMIAANYLSAFVGRYLLSEYWAERIDRMPLHDWAASIPWIIAFGFVTTLFIEWPFVAQIVKARRKPEGKGWWLKAFQITFCIHLLTYSLIVFWYYHAYDTSLIRRLKPAALPAAWVPEEAKIFYISADDDRVYICRLDGSSREIFSDRVIPKNVSLRPSEANGVWSLTLGDTPDILLKVRNGRFFNNLTMVAEDVMGEGSLIKQPSQWDLSFTWKEDDRRERMGLNVLFQVEGYMSPIWLPNDLVVISVGRRLAVVNLRTLELAEIANARSLPAVYWRAPLVEKESLDLPGAQ